MKKNIALSFLCLCTVLFVLTGCKPKEDNADSDAPVTLSVYMQMDLANPQSAYWPETVAAFEKQYPNIKLEFEYVNGEAFHD